MFRINAEWLAMRTQVFQEVAEHRPVHSLPRRRPGIVLGLVNIRGELLICVSLGHLLGLERTRIGQTLRRTYDRLLVTNWEGNRLVFPADEVRGIHRFHCSELKEPPATLAKSNFSYTQGVLSWAGRSVGLLDAERFVFVPQSESDVKKSKLEDVSNLSMLELFRVEAEQQTDMLTSGLLEIERSPAAPRPWEMLMRPPTPSRGRRASSIFRAQSEWLMPWRIVSPWPSKGNWSYGSRKLICSFAALICWGRSRSKPKRISPGGTPIMTMKCANS